MDTIKIQNKNHSFLHVDCEPSIANELSDFFTFYVPGYKFMPAYKNKIWDGKIRLYDVRKKELPAGLFRYVEEFAGTPGRDYQLELLYDNYYGLPNAEADIDMSFMKEMTITSKGQLIQPRDYQLSAIEHGLRNKRALLISPTASGKSLIIYSMLRWYLQNNDKKVIIIVPT